MDSSPPSFLHTCRPSPPRSSLDPVPEWSLSTTSCFRVSPEGSPPTKFLSLRIWLTSLCRQRSRGLPYNRHSTDAHSLIPHSPVPGGPSRLLWVALAPCQEQKHCLGEGRIISRKRCNQGEKAARPWAPTHLIGATCWLLRSRAGEWKGQALLTFLMEARQKPLPAPHTHLLIAQRRVGGGSQRYRSPIAVPFRARTQSHGPGTCSPNVQEAPALGQALAVSNTHDLVLPGLICLSNPNE